MQSFLEFASIRDGGEDTTFEAKARTLKKSAAKTKDRVAEDRLPRCQRQKGSRPRPRTRGHVWKYAQI